MGPRRLIERLKIMAGMDIAEKRLPQDGRLRSTAEDGTEVDFRVSTLRTPTARRSHACSTIAGVPPLEKSASATSLEELRGCAISTG